MKEGDEFTFHPDVNGLTDEQARLGEAAAKSKSGGKWDHFTPEFVGTKAQEFSLGDLQRQINASRDIFLAGRLSQPEGEVRIDSPWPIAIAFLGDLHLGSIYTNTDEVLRKVDVVKRTPNLYACFMSNLIDNAIPSQFPSNMLVNAIPPDKQVVMIRKITEELNGMGKLVGAVTSPCHEGWTYKHTGQDINALMFGFPERKFPVVENGGRINIHAGEALYVLALFHQCGVYESNFNETHALRQLNRLNLGMEADCVVGAHRHVATAQVVYEKTGEHRKTVAYIRSGTEKGTSIPHDQYSVDRYGTTGEPTGQILHIWPNERKLDATCDFDLGVNSHMDHYMMAVAMSHLAN